MIKGINIRFIQNLKVAIDEFNEWLTFEYIFMSFILVNYFNWFFIFIFIYHDRKS